MAPDLLSTIRREIDERLSELRPLLAEQERLLSAVEALEVARDQSDAASVSEPAATKPAAPAKSVSAKAIRRRARPSATHRGSAVGAIELAVTGPVGVAVEGGNGKDKPERSARGVVREVILAALDHGSHTVGELAMVTAMSGPNINGNLRKLVAEGAVVKIEREGKAAWALALRPSRTR